MIFFHDCAKIEKSRQSKRKRKCKRKRKRKQAMLQYRLAASMHISHRVVSIVLTVI